MSFDWFDDDLPMPGQMLPAVGVLGQSLRDARDARLLSQKQLAERAGVAQSVVSRLERGRREPSWALFCRLLDVLDLEPVVTTRRKRSALEREIDDLRPLSPEQRWLRAFVPVSALADAMDATPDLVDNWALDGDAALVGHGLPLTPETFAVSIRDEDPVRAAAEAVAAGWPDLDVRVRSPLPQSVALDAEGRAIPVLPIEHVAPSSDAGVAALAAWAAHVTLGR
jgi:transcriptional regulator with XRE-family HTH domain